MYDLALFYSLIVPVGGQRCTFRLSVMCSRNRNSVLQCVRQVAYYIGRGCDIVLCIEYLPEDAAVEGELVSNFIR